MNAGLPWPTQDPIGFISDLIEWYPPRHWAPSRRYRVNQISACNNASGDPRGTQYQQINERQQNGWEQRFLLGFKRRNDHNKNGNSNGEKNRTQFESDSQSRDQKYPNNFGS